MECCRFKGGAAGYAGMKLRFAWASPLNQGKDCFEGLGGWLPKLPRVAADGGFGRHPQALAGLVAGPLEAQKGSRAAKFCPRSRDSGTVGDALSSLVEPGRRKQQS